MALRVPSLADGRDPLFVVGVLAMMLGLGAAGAGFVGREPLLEETAAGSSPPAGTVLSGATASPLTGGDRCGGDPGCHPGHPHPSRPGTVVRASIDVDPREYLSKMAALRLRRPVATVTVPDPYQASLNPSVYLAGDATPIARDGSSTSVPHDQPCRFR